MSPPRAHNRGASCVDCCGKPPRPIQQADAQQAARAKTSATFSGKQQRNPQCSSEMRYLARRNALASVPYSSTY